MQFSYNLYILFLQVTGIYFLLIFILYIKMRIITIFIMTKYRFVINLAFIDISYNIAIKELKKCSCC